MKLPDFEEIELITNNPRQRDNKEENKKVISRILNNINNIKLIEKENIKLKKILIENQKDISKKRIDDIVSLLNSKDSKHKEFSKKILEDYKRFKSSIKQDLVSEQKKYFELKKKYETARDRYKELDLNNQKIINKYQKRNQFSELERAGTFILGFGLAFGSIYAADKLNSN